jgi:excisionase family DNA binding protein
VSNQDFDTDADSEERRHIELGRAVEHVLQVMLDRTLPNIVDRVQSAKPQLGRLLDVGETARYLSKTPAAIRQMIARKQIPIVKIGRRLRCDREALDRFIERQTE